MKFLLFMAWMLFLLIVILMAYQAGRNDVCHRRGYELFDISKGACVRSSTVYETEAK